MRAHSVQTKKLQGKVSRFPIFPMSRTSPFLHSMDSPAWTRPHGQHAGLRLSWVSQRDSSDVGTGQISGRTAGRTR